MLSLEEVKRYLGDDHFAVAQGICIDEVSEDGAVCSLRLEKRHLNSQGTAQGGILFTLADMAFAAASNARAKGTVTLNATINYLRPGTGPLLTAVAHLVEGGKKTCVYEVQVKNQDGTPVALFTATGYTKSHYVDKLETR